MTTSHLTDNLNTSVIRESLIRFCEIHDPQALQRCDFDHLTRYVQKEGIAAMDAKLKKQSGYTLSSVLEYRAKQGHNNQRFRNVDDGVDFDKAVLFSRLSAFYNKHCERGRPTQQKTHA